MNKQAPTITGRLPPPRESETLSQCLKILGILGVNAQRQNTGVGVYRNKDGTERRVHFGRAGNLDLAGDLDGRRFELEVKRPPHRDRRGRLVRSQPTPQQYQRMNEINQRGGVAFWTNDPTKLLEIIPRIRSGERVYIDRTGSVVLTDEPIDPTQEGWRP